MVHPEPMTTTAGGPVHRWDESSTTDVQNHIGDSRPLFHAPSGSLAVVNVTLSVVSALIVLLILAEVAR